jgi:hypothetical protein
MMHYKKKAAMAALGLAAAFSGSTALAAITTLTGTTVSYSYDDADLGLFGAGVLSGDQLLFAPSDFAATSTNGGFAFSTIHVTVTANSGYQLSSFNLSEGGSYSLGGIGASAGVTGEFGALDIEGTTANYIPVTIQASAPLDGATANWTAQAGVNLPATGWGGVDGLVGSVRLTISNQLYIDGVASIAKEFVNISTSTVATPVPEAKTYAMLLVGLGLVGFMARRARMTV